MISKPCAAQQISLAINGYHYYCCPQIINRTCLHSGKVVCGHYFKCVSTPTVTNSPALW